MLHSILAKMPGSNNVTQYEYKSYTLLLKTMLSNVNSRMSIKENFVRKPSRKRINSLGPTPLPKNRVLLGTES